MGIRKHTFNYGYFNKIDTEKKRIGWVSYLQMVVFLRGIANSFFGNGR